MDRLPRWRELVWAGWCYIEFQVATAFCSFIRRRCSHDHQQIIDLWTIVVMCVTKCLSVELLIVFVVQSKFGTSFPSTRCAPCVFVCANPHSLVSVLMIVGLVVGGVLVRRRRASHRLSPPNPRKVKAVQEGVYLRVVHAATERFVLVDPVNALVIILRDLIHRRRDANPPDPSRRTDEPGREPISARSATDASRVQPLHRPLQFTQFRILVDIRMRTLRRPRLHPASRRLDASLPTSSPRLGGEERWVSPQIYKTRSSREIRAQLHNLPWVSQPRRSRWVHAGCWRDLASEAARTCHEQRVRRPLSGGRLSEEK